MEFTEVQMREMWAYSDGSRTVRAYWSPDGPAGDAWDAGAGSWALVDQASGHVQDVVRAGEFSRQFQPVDEFAEVTKFPTYLGTVAAADGTALVDLLLDHNPFMLANGPGRVARPHALMVPRRHRDGWSSATEQELAARHTAMNLVAAWYRSLDGGAVVFAANDSPPNLDYLRDAESAHGTLAGVGADVAVRRNPRQEVQHAHLHAFYLEREETENRESAVLALGQRAFGDVLGGDAVLVEAVPSHSGSAAFITDVRDIAEPWGGGYCSYQLGPDGPLSVMPARGQSQDEFNRRLARADGLQAEPDPRLGGAVNLVRPSLAAAGRREAADRATAQQRASFTAFAAGRGLDPVSLH